MAHASDNEYSEEEEINSDQERHITRLRRLGIDALPPDLQNEMGSYIGDRERRQQRMAQRIAEMRRQIRPADSNDFIKNQVQDFQFEKVDKVNMEELPSIDEVQVMDHCGICL